MSIANMHSVYMLG